MNAKRQITDYAAAQEYLVGLKKRGVQLGLERMRGFVAALGHPERAIPFVHVAGTNGKGSVCAMLEAIFRAAGWRTGLYTSPHLVRLGERIQVNRQPINDDELTARVRVLSDIVASLPDADQPSYFEFMTGLAFAHFAAARCDIAIIETGLGGRIDATNVVAPEAAVITSIGLDHCEFLGDTLAQIATEKAGIIKPGRPVVVGVLPAAADSVIRRIASERGTPLHSVAERFAAPENYPATNLAGAHQRTNAAIAMVAANVLAERWKLTNEVVSRGLQNVDWPGRWTVREVGGRRIIIDGAHNADGAAALDTELSRLATAGVRPPIVVMGVLGAARARPLVEAAARHARELRLVVPQQTRACTIAELTALVPATFRGAVIPARVEEIFPARDVCRAGEPGDTVLVTGSLYLAGEVLARLDPARGPFEPHLQDF